MISESSAGEHDGTDITTVIGLFPDVEFRPPVQQPDPNNCPPADATLPQTMEDVRAQQAARRQEFDTLFIDRQQARGSVNYRNLEPRWATTVNRLRRLLSWSYPL